MYAVTEWAVQRLKGVRFTDPMALLEELEETARLWLLSERRPTPLTDTQINDLRAQFNAPW